MAAAGTVTVDPTRGLSASEVAEREARGQINDVPAAPTRTVAQIVRANVLTRFNALLGAMLVLILIVGPIQDALFGVVLVTNALIGIVQELRAKRTLDRLTLLTAPKALVVRDGTVRELVAVQHRGRRHPLAPARVPDRRRRRGRDRRGPRGGRIPAHR